MIKFFAILVVISFGIAGAAYWRLTAEDKKEEQKRLDAEAKRQREAQVQKVEAKEEVKEEVRGIRMVPSDVNSPVLETPEGSYRRGNLVESGEVKDVRGGIAVIGWGKKVHYDITSQSETRTEVVSVGGRVWNDQGLEAVLLRDGDVLRVGQFCRRGKVERMSEERADVRRQDGGWLFVCFSAVRDDDKERFSVATSTNAPVRIDLPK